MDGFARRKERKKLNIFEAAVELFEKFGTQKVSISEIAKRANVSQVTIYNYFGSKEQLIQEVIIYYVDVVWAQYEQLLDSHLSFEEKVKHMIFSKKDDAQRVGEYFFQDIMKEYAKGMKYVEEIYSQKVIPRLIKFLNDGKEAGIIHPSISNEAILIFIEMFRQYAIQGEGNNNILPFTEDLTKLFFYGIVGEEKSV